MSSFSRSERFRSRYFDTETLRDLRELDLSGLHEFAYLFLTYDIGRNVSMCGKCNIDFVIISTMSRIDSYIKLNSHQCKLLLIYRASCDDRENLASTFQTSQQWIFPSDLADLQNFLMITTSFCNQSNDTTTDLHYDKHSSTHSIQALQ